MGAAGGGPGVGAAGKAACSAGACAAGACAAGACTAGACAAGACAAGAFAAGACSAGGESPSSGSPIPPMASSWARTSEKSRITVATSSSSSSSDESSSASSRGGSCATSGSGCHASSRLRRVETRDTRFARSLDRNWSSTRWRSSSPTSKTARGAGAALMIRFRISGAVSPA